jgi:predicted ATPase
VLGRRIQVARACGRVLDAHFAELCEQPLGAADYLVCACAHTPSDDCSQVQVLARVFHTIMLRNVPSFSMDNLNAARRFITLIDTLYDQKCRLVVSAHVRADALFRVQPTSTADGHRVAEMEVRIKDGQQVNGVQLCTIEPGFVYRTPPPL